MNKNKKLVSFICAIAMMLSIFSSFTIASAAEAGFTLSTPKMVDSDSKVFEVNVGYEGITSGVASGSFKITLPAEVEKVEVVKGSIFELLPGNIFSYSFAYTNAATADEDGNIDTLKITLSEGLKEDVDISINAGSYVSTRDKVDFEVGLATNGLKSPSVTLPRDLNAPTPKPITTTTPQPPVVEPSDKPVINEPITATKGYTLSTPVVSEDGLTVTLDVNYVGITSGLASGSFKISMPAEVEKVEVVKGSIYELLAGNIFSYSFAYTNSATDDESGKVDTLTLTLSTPLKYDNQLTILDGSYWTGKDKIDHDIGKDGILGSNMVIPAFSGEEPVKDVAGTIDLSKAITIPAVTDGVTGGVSDFFIIPVVMKGTAAAVYGDDFVAEFDGEKLTAAQYSNLINGYFDADNVKKFGVTSMNDVISKLSFVLYNKDVTVSAKLVERSTGEIQNPDDGEVTLQPSPTPPAPKAPSISVKAASTSMKINSTLKITTTIKNPVEGGKLVYKSSNENILDLISETDPVDNVATAKFESFEKTGSAKITVDYVNADGSAISGVTEKSVTIKVTKDSDVVGGGSGTTGDTTGGGGIIAGPANPNQEGPSTGYVPNFQDLGSVPWAVEAINGLAAKGMISGRDQYTFDPNANITRAEYCQMLMGALRLLGGESSSTFTDVPSNAWYYNAVSNASQLGIVSGYGDGNFGPTNLITRQDMTLMTYNAAKYMNKSLAEVNAAIAFEDANQISDYAVEAVTVLQKAGIINGMTDTTFEPLSNATRAQSAKVIYDTFVK